MCCSRGACTTRLAFGSDKVKLHEVLMWYVSIKWLLLLDLLTSVSPEGECASASKPRQHAAGRIASLVQYFARFLTGPVYARKNNHCAHCIPYKACQDHPSYRTHQAEQLHLRKHEVAANALDTCRMARAQLKHLRAPLEGEQAPAAAPLAA